MKRFVLFGLAAALGALADGTESSPNGSTATAGVAPGSPASFSVVVQ